MKGLIFVYGSLVFICLGAIVRPWIGVVGYFGFAILNPVYLWGHSLPPNSNFQKYIVGATFIGLLLSGFKGNKIQGAPAWAIISLALYLAWAWVTAQFTIHEGDTTFYMTTIWKIVLMSCVGLLLIDTPKKIVTLMWVIVIAQGWNAWEINLQYFQDGYCYAAYHGWGIADNNGYSILTVPIMGASLGLAFYSPKLWTRIFAGFIFTLQMHQIMLLESRGTMIGALCLAGIGAWYVHKNSWTISTILVSIALGAALAGPSVVEEFSSSFASGEELDASADSRFKLWKAGVEITQDYPLLGVGPNATGRLVPQYYEGGLDTSHKVLHNLIFDVSTGSGIPGVILYCAFFGLTWWAVRVRWKKEKATLPDWAKPPLFSTLCGVPGYIVSSMFSSGALLESSYIGVIVGASTLLILAKARTANHEAAINIERVHSHHV
ncbi:O-antigen ligase family protein [Thalassoglobus polymorphus]|uniref:O-Antigen ligase n=1 Tax=Thalassoglobus polymorphus TaxID=2527994 RepID=A0A517QSN8_9PLAN|nr:O-antigen ligase family protein [Thalassoglobus polymorphus]QDT34635.1 O-Antigen ligase [Thalassoglobus polymorphus]